MQHGPGPATIRSAIKATFVKLIGTTLPRRRTHDGRRRPSQALFRRQPAAHLSAMPVEPMTPPAPPSPSPDIVALTILAANRLGPACIRASATGRTLRLAVPDAQTASIFDAALAQMRKNRVTDRLVEVVVDSADAERS